MGRGADTGGQLGQALLPEGMDMCRPPCPPVHRLWGFRVTDMAGGGAFVFCLCRILYLHLRSRIILGRLQTQREPICFMVSANR